jgi:hypothetical protein
VAAASLFLKKKKFYKRLAAACMHAAAYACMRLRMLAYGAQQRQPAFF